MHRRALWAFCLLFFVLPAVHSQIDTAFWFAAPKIVGGGTNTYRLAITTMREPAHITIKVGNTVVVNNYFISKGDTTVFFNLTSALIEPANNLIENKGIFVRACDYIVAYFEIVSKNNRDMFSLKGSNALGTSFIIPAQDQWANATYVPQPVSAIHIVSAEAGNNISINYTKPAPGTTNITLNQGQTYTIVAPDKSALNHLYGSTITSSNGRKFAVTVSDDYVEVPYELFPSTSIYYNAIGDQLIPRSLLGTEYIVPRGTAKIWPFQNEPLNDGYFSGEICMIESPTSGTAITVNGIPWKTTTVNNQSDTLRMTASTMHLSLIHI